MEKIGKYLKKNIVKYLKSKTVYRLTLFLVVIVFLFGLKTENMFADFYAPSSPSYSLSKNTQNGSTVGDFDNDGFMDVATVSFQDSKISIVLNQKNRTFDPRLSFLAGSGSRAITAGDFNNDKNLDLATVNYYGNSVSVFLGQGDGNFDNKVDYSTLSAYPTNIITGDFNNDKNLDLAFTSLDYYNFGVLLGQGNGSFNKAITQVIGITNLMDLVSGYFNTDDKMDLAVIGGGAVWTLAGKGDGTFINPVRRPLPGSSGWSNVILGDLDQDSKIDLIAGLVGGDMAVFFGKGDGEFESPRYYPAGGGGGGALSDNPICIGDLDSDGITDLVSGNIGLEILKKSGSRDYTISQHLGNNLINGVNCRDFDNDGKMDLAELSGGNLSFYFNQTRVDHRAINVKVKWIQDGQEKSVNFSEILGEIK